MRNIILSLICGDLILLALQEFAWNSTKVNDNTPLNPLSRGAYRNSPLERGFRGVLSCLSVEVRFLAQIPEEPGRGKILGAEGRGLNGIY